MNNAKEWERQYGQMKVRAERAEERVRELEALLRAEKAPKIVEPMAKLVQVGPGHWEYQE